MSGFTIKHYLDLERQPHWQVVAPTGQGVISCASQDLAKFIARALNRKPMVEKLLQAESSRIKTLKNTN